MRQEGMPWEGLFVPDDPPLCLIAIRPVSLALHGLVRKGSWKQGRQCITVAYP
jgi:hypothetical protein